MVIYKLCKECNNKIEYLTFGKYTYNLEKYTCDKCKLANFEKKIESFKEKLNGANINGFRITVYMSNNFSIKLSLSTKQCEPISLDINSNITATNGVDFYKLTYDDVITTIKEKIEKSCSKCSKCDNYYSHTYSHFIARDQNMSFNGMCIECIDKAKESHPDYINKERYRSDPEYKKECDNRFKTLLKVYSKGKD